MATLRRSEAAIQGDALSAAIAATLGREARATRRRRRHTQQQLADLIGISRSRYADIERGEGATAPLETWAKIGAALGRPLAAAFSRDIEAPEPRDAGHLAAQELVLRLARSHGRPASFELPTRPADPARSADVGLRDDAAGALILIEIWNRLDDLGATARAADRKVVEASAHAAAAGGDAGPYRVASCWLLVDTAANRHLVARYPAILRTRFPGSSLRWAAALTNGMAPPLEPGVAWIDPRAGRIVPLRLR
ncbi:MAG: XRE family transcriptional regulator [Chloroflexota bacterium]|nr:MAG: XRE family transcriptional regulator [Chloroflexota bacterium]